VGTVDCRFQTTLKLPIPYQEMKEGGALFCAGAPQNWINPRGPRDIYMAWHQIICDGESNVGLGGRISKPKRSSTRICLRKFKLFIIAPTLGDEVCGPRLQDEWRRLNRREG
jgi:hypothetical protein